MKHFYFKALAVVCMSLCGFTAKAQSDLILTGIVDGDLSGGLPKALEFYVANDIADLSIYGLARGNNGTPAPTAPDVTLDTVSVTAGSFYYLTSDSTAFHDYFGFAANMVSSSQSINNNGDDVIHLFKDGVLVDAYGENGVNGDGTSWDYTDGWGYRVDGTGPNPVFTASEWIPGAFALDGAATNAEATNPFPFGTYSLEVDPDEPVSLSFSTSSLSVDENEGTITAMVGIQNPADTETTVEVVVSGGTAVEDTDFTYTTTTLTFPASSTDPQSFTFDVMDNEDLNEEDLTIVFSLANATNDATLGSDLTVTIEDDEFEITPIAIVAEDDDDFMPVNLDQEYTITGVVYGVNTNVNGLQFVMMDQTGAISVYSSSPVDDYIVTEGDSLILTGEVGFFNGLTQITPSSIVLLSQDNGLVDPIVVTEFDELLESYLVKIECVSVVDTAEWTNSGSGFNVTFTDGENDYLVRIDNDVDLFDMEAPEGTFDVVGLIGQYDGDAPYDTGYQLLPRYAADFVDNESCTSSISSINKINFSVFPNPSQGDITITSEELVEAVYITDVVGKTVKEIAVVTGTSVKVDVSDLSKGVYVVTIKGQNNSIGTEKLIVE